MAECNIIWGVGTRDHSHYRNGDNSPNDVDNHPHYIQIFKFHDIEIAKKTRTVQPALHNIGTYSGLMLILIIT